MAVDRGSCLSSPWLIEGWRKRTSIMGIINVTPDSFSDGGERVSADSAVEGALRMVQEGADFIDVGAESTRPGAEEITLEEEWRRLEPVLNSFRGRVAVPVSVDTYKAEIARRALEAGVSIVNDVWGLKREPAIAEVAASAGAGLVLMHNGRGEDPAGDLMAGISRSLEESVRIANRAGVDGDRIVLDPGIGFGKSVRENIEILRRFGELRTLGFPLLLGASRKSVIGKTLNLPVAERLEGTLATTVAGVVGGADVIRVHDIDPNLKAARMGDAIYRSYE